MTPPCAATALVVALVFERGVVDSPVVREPPLATELAVLLGVVAVLVFILLLAEFALVQLTSSLTLSILGILKEFITILMAGWAKGEPLTAMKLTGFFLCASGAVLHHVVKSRSVGSLAAGKQALASRTAGEGRAWTELDEVQETEPSVRPPTTTTTAAQQEQHGQATPVAGRTPTPASGRL
eukprot:4551999-Prymnesium_polylepis.1